MRLNWLKYWALALIIRRALSSESGFLRFLDLGFGLLPSLRDQGSGVIEQLQRKVVAFGLDLWIWGVLEGGGFEEDGILRGGFMVAVVAAADGHRKEDFRASISTGEVGKNLCLRKIKVDGEGGKKKITLVWWSVQKIG